MVIQRTNAATRCGLQGSYWLQVGPESLLLKDTQNKNIVREWPYELVRRYGKDKVRLSISYLYIAVVCCIEPVILTVVSSMNMLYLPLVITSWP